ncbi:retinol dehydrogenase 12-like [Arapaima gigas]
MEWNCVQIFSHPAWAISTFILFFIIKAQQKSAWNPRKCKVQLKGKTAIVTGANTGIGKFIALDLARRDARVILGCRSAARGAAAMREIRQRSGNPNVHVRLVDTSSLSSVREFCQAVLAEEDRLDILVNNAGASGLPRGITPEGLEVSFATNHVGPFLLTHLLLDLMKHSAPARIVNVSSFNHRKGKVDFSHFKGENLTYILDSVYNHTKLHNILWTNELARRLQGTGVTANSLHPGVVMTEMMRHYHWLIRLVFRMVGIFFFKSAEQGAVSSLYCAVAEETEGITGKYFDSNCSLVLPSPLARDPVLAAKSFEYCERLVAAKL